MAASPSRVAGRNWLYNGLDDPQSKRNKSVLLPGGSPCARMQ